MNTAPCFGEPRQEQQIGRKTVSILLIPDQWPVRHSNFRYYYLRLELTRWPEGQKAANLKSRPVLRSAQLLRYTVRYSVVTLQRVLSILSHCVMRYCHTCHTYFVIVMRGLFFKCTRCMFFACFFVFCAFFNAVLQLLEPN